MRVKAIRLQTFKRFTDLAIQDLPDTARLVVLVGPNGSGKSSLFEAFNVYSNRMKNYNASDADYWTKNVTANRIAPTSVSVWSLWNNQVQIEFHDYQALATGEPTEADRKAFYIRSSYRHEGDFSVNAISKAGDLLDDPKRPPFLISQDVRVSDNYQRLVATSLAEIFDRSLADDTSRKDIRGRLIGDVATSLKRVLPDLELLEPGDPVQDGTFFFQKGNAHNWRYKNLSGEKAAFDLLLDFVVKVQRFDNTVFCIDEPEIHTHTAVQAALLEEMLWQMPAQNQLWIATHSAGMMRAARDLYAQRPGEVAFLDFGGHDFDETIVMRPSTPDRAFWKRNFEVALGDLAQLVAPSHIVFCEGNTPQHGSGFDAQCYETIFSSVFSDVEFVSTGGVSDLQKNAFSVSAVMERILSGVQFTTVRDRDDATDHEVREWKASGLRVLSRRTIESLLWDEEILERLCIKLEQQDKIAEVKTLKRRELENSRQRGNPIDDVKSAAGNIYAGLRRILDTRGLGSTRQAFSRDTLAPLITPDTRVYQELERDIFGPIT